MWECVSSTVRLKCEIKEFDPSQVPWKSFMWECMSSTAGRYNINGVTVYSPTR